jgi:hypothetical protein
MRTTTLAAVFIIVFPAPLLLAWQDQARKAELINQLQTAYPLTVMDGIKVLKPGTLLVIQQDGIQANPMKLGPFQNRYENGQVTAGGYDRLRKYDPTGGLTHLPGRMQPRILVAGEKAYLLKLEARDDGINMTLQTCGICDPAAVDPAYKPCVASIQFGFTKGFWSATDLNHLQAAIDPLLAFPYGANAAREPQSTPPAPARTQTAVKEASQQPAAFPDLTPPERPAETQSETAPVKRPPTLRRADEIQAPAQTSADERANQPARNLPAPARPIKTESEITTEVKPESQTASKPEPKPEINPGWTPNQVVAVLGNPNKKDKPDRGLEVYTYEHLTVTFENGKVVGIVSSR